MSTEKALKAVETAIDKAYESGRLEAIVLAEKVIEILDVKARTGTDEYIWQNGNGEDLSTCFEELIQEAKDYLNKNNSK